MAIDCNEVLSTLAYNCTYPWGQGCTNSKGFDFVSLWEITQNIQKACANDARLFIDAKGSTVTGQNAALTQESCSAIAGPEWNYYPGFDILQRLGTWKMPLLQLVASFPRPPLGFWIQCFVIIHLLGDPVDTIKNLLLKLSECQHFADYWRGEYPALFGKSIEEGGDRDWKSLTLVTDAYAEWGEEERARAALHEALLGFEHNSKDKSELKALLHETANALAADRATNFLPIIVAQCFFIAAVGIAIGRTASAAGTPTSSDTVFINVEAHSIAFSAQYFWIVPAVFLGSVIGVSQTEAAVPHILRQLQRNLDSSGLPRTINLPNEWLDSMSRRISGSGIYSWQPSKWQWRLISRSRSSSVRKPTISSLENQGGAPAINVESFHKGQHQYATGSAGLRQTLEEVVRVLFPYLIVVMGTIAGMVVSALVPPDGWDCRHIGEVLILAIWLLSSLFDVFLNFCIPLNGNNQSSLFWTTGMKDTIAAAATLGGIFVYQLGVFNRCTCYTQWGNTGLALPYMPDVAKALQYRLSTAYPAITFTCIGIECLVVPALIVFRYNNSIRVYVQRDDQRSNASWMWTVYRNF